MTTETWTRLVAIFGGDWPYDWEDLAYETEDDDLRAHFAAVGVIDLDDEDDHRHRFDIEGIDY